MGLRRCFVGLLLFVKNDVVCCSSFGCRRRKIWIRHIRDPLQSRKRMRTGQLDHSPRVPYFSSREDKGLFLPGTDYLVGCYSPTASCRPPTLPHRAVHGLMGHGGKPSLFQLDRRFVLKRLPTPMIAIERLGLWLLNEDSVKKRCGRIE
jgi:hypothetical protein